MTDFLADRQDTLFLGLHNVDPVPGRKNVVLVDDLRCLLEEARGDGWTFRPDRVGRKKMILTFDDGRLVHDELFDLLDEFGATALFFVCTDRVIRSYPAEGAGGAPMTPANVARLRGRHFVGSHTRDHRDLSELDMDESLRYLEDSFDRFTEVYGERPRIFSYPWGRYNRYTLKALDALGIEFAFLAGGGRERPLAHRYLIPRTLLDGPGFGALSLEAVLADNHRTSRWIKLQARNVWALRR